jgi:dTMP kinase
MMRQSFFLTLEGPDGCGKSTQARLLVDFLENRGHEVLVTREPGGTPLAEEIRRVILTPSPEALDPMAEILLYTASRAQHVHKLIKPALELGNVVVCERFMDSTLAYQGYGLGWDLDFIREINRMAIGEFKPDLTFLLDVEAEECFRRVNNRSGLSKGEIDRIEARGVSFQRKVRQGFLEMAKSDPRIALISSTHKSIKEIHAQMVAVLTAKMTRE